MEIIGLSGKAGTGKDWIAKHILQPKGYLPFSFAWHFKVFIVGSKQATHEEVFITKPPHVRKALQLEGTEKGRDIYGPDIWCEVLEEWLVLLNEQWGVDKFVIPDCRFISEVELINRMGGSCYRIVAPEREANNGLTPEARLHISETELDGYIGFDATIYNDPKHQDTVKDQVENLLNFKTHPFRKNVTGEWLL